MARRKIVFEFPGAEVLDGLPMAAYPETALFFQEGGAYVVGRIDKRAALPAGGLYDPGAAVGIGIELAVGPGDAAYRIGRGIFAQKDLKGRAGLENYPRQSVRGAEPDSPASVHVKHIGVFYIRDMGV